MRIPAGENHQTLKVLIFYPKVFSVMKSHLFKKKEIKITHLPNGCGTMFLHVDYFVSVAGYKILKKGAILI